MDLRSELSDSSLQEQTPSPDRQISTHDFDETQCLFCDQHNPDLDHNLAHMSKAHGLHVELRNLIVEVADLLAYFHLIISECYECIYCGTQRNTRQAAQQHMTAKGHCRYDIDNEDAGYQDFYDLSPSPSSSENEEEFHMGGTDASLDGVQTSILAGARRKHRSKRTARSDNNPHPSSIDNYISVQRPDSDNETTSPTDPIPPSSPSSTALGPLSNRAAKQSIRVDNQLSHMRASDRASLAHLPSSQQRALLAVHHNQMAKSRKEEQTRRGRLESAANSFGRLGTTRLVRIPPHLGHVQTLKR